MIIPYLSLIGRLENVLELKKVEATAGKRGMKFWDFSNPAKISFNKGIFGKEKMAGVCQAQWIIICMVNL